MEWDLTVIRFCARFPVYKIYVVYNMQYMVTKHFTPSVPTKWPGEVTKKCDAVTTDFEGNVCILKTERTDDLVGGRPLRKIS